MERAIEEKLKKDKKKKIRKETALAYAMMSPYLIIFLVFAFIPCICGVVFSFMKYNPYVTQNNQFVGFQNFANVFNFNSEVSKLFWNSFTTTIVFDLVAVPLLIIIPLGLAFLINMHPPGHKIFRAIIYLPSVISISVLGILFGCLFAGDKSGLVNAWLGTEIKWLSGTAWKDDFLRWFVILLASIWWQTGTNFVIIAGAMRDVPKSLYEACEMDGGGAWRKFVKITLPHIKPALAICLFNTLIGYLALYGQPYVLHDEANKSDLVSPMMFIQSFLNNNAYAGATGFICACALTFGAITIVVSVVERKLTSGRKRRRKSLPVVKNYF